MPPRNLPASALRPLQIACLVGLVPAALIIRTVFWPGPDGVDPYGFTMGRDFVNFWSAARLTLAGRLPELYDLDAYIAAVRAMFHAGQTFINFSYPPHILPLVWPLGLAPYGVALALWEVAGLAALMATAFAGTDRAMARRLAPWLLLAPVTLLNVTLAQAGFWLAALFVGGFRLVPTRPVLAGILFGLLTVKPHLGLIVPPALILMGAWRTIASATATTLVLVGASLALFGTTPWHDYVANTLPYQRRIVEEMVGLYTTMMTTPYAEAWWLGVPARAALAIHGVVAAAVLAATLLLVRRADPERRIVLLALAAVILTPYSLNYDLVVPAAAIALWLATRPQPLSRPLAWALGAFWFLPFAGMLLTLVGLPLAPLAATVLFAVLARESFATLRAPATASPLAA